MAYTLKNLTVFFDLSEPGLRILEYAAEQAGRFDSYLVAVYAGVQAHTCYSSGFARGKEAVESVTTHRAEVIKAASEKANQYLSLLAQKYNIRYEFRLFDTSQSSEVLPLHTLYCDLIICGSPQLPELPPEKTPQKMLLKTGVPALVIPTSWQGSIGRRVIVAWNASRVARRAIADAVPMLTAADSVQILIIDPENYPHGEEPGANIALYLSRHGVNVDVVCINSNGRAVSDVMIEQAKQYEADLMVLGAYSTSRLVEMVLGGVTQTLLSQVPLPLFISH